MRRWLPNACVRLSRPAGAGGLGPGFVGGDRSASEPPPAARRALTWPDLLASAEYALYRAEVEWPQPRRGLRPIFAGEGCPGDACSARPRSGGRVVCSGSRCGQRACGGLDLKLRLVYSEVTKCGRQQCRSQRCVYRRRAHHFTRMWRSWTPSLCRVQRPGYTVPRRPRLACRSGPGRARSPLPDEFL